MPPERAGGWGQAAACGLGLLGVYARTLYAGVSGGDATELVFNACQGSVAHPPGYPTFTLLGALFVRALPGGWGPPAWRVNAAAAACGALAGLFVYRAAHRLTGCPASALAAAGMFSLNRLVWNYSIQGEVFAMNNMFLAALFCALVEFARSRARSVALMGAFLSGLALTNQHTSVFYVAPVVVYVLLCDHGRLLRPAALLQLTVCFLCGLLPYAYLPIASLRGLPGSWGDTASFDGFLTHLLRREYGTLRLFSGNNAEDTPLLTGLALYAASFFRESGLLGATGYVAGAWVALLERGWVGQAAKLVLFNHVFYTVVFHKMANLPLQDELYVGVHSRFWMQSDLAACLIAALGLSRGVRAARGVVRARTKATWGPKHLPLHTAVLAVGLAAMARIPEMDESGNRVIEEYGRWLLRPLPQGAKLIVKGDLITNTIRYLQVCEGHRADVEVVDMSMMTYRWFLKVQGPNFPSFQWPGSHYHPHEQDIGGFSMKQLLDVNIQPGAPPLFMAGGWHEQDPSPLASYAHVPVGYVDLVQPAAETFEGLLQPWNHSVWGWYNATRGFNPTGLLPETKLWDMSRRWERVVVNDFFQIHHKKAHALLEWVMRHSPQAADGTIDSAEHAEALGEVESVLLAILEGWPEFVGDMPHHFLLNLGIVYQLMLRVPGIDREKAHGAMLHAWGEWLRRDPPDSPNKMAIADFLRRSSGGAGAEG